MQDIFHTGSIGLPEWGLAVIGGIIVLAVAEFDKIIRLLMNKKAA